MGLGQILLLGAPMLATGAGGAITGGNSLINVPPMITVGMRRRSFVRALFRLTVAALAAKPLLWDLLLRR
ncbi:MAG TPA: hypothetical protein VFG23_09745 [Polyangia bacterium]|nr:hypothetical protein [Polyangia bacterium]